MTSPPEVIADRYALVELIGKGGMGSVYRGEHLGTGRSVAIKLVAGSADELAAKRFLREARIAAALSHPNLVEVLDVGTTGEGQMYMALELLVGEPLDAHLRRKGPLRAMDALDTLIPILDALAVLHDAGVVHRDVKPANIFLSVDGSARIVPKLLDLGISKPLEGGQTLTETGMMLGTPHYMAPEQARGMLDVGVGVDIWAMGVVLFESIVGRRPFVADNIPGLLHKIATDRPPRIGTLVPELPPALAMAIDHALAYEPSSRPASARDLADALVDAAVESGWSLTCRLPTGPRLSLQPRASSQPTSVASSQSTPLLGTADTPVLPISAKASPEPAPSSPAGTRPLGARPSFVSDPTAPVESPPPMRAAVAPAEPAEAPAEPPREPPSAAPASESPTPSEPALSTATALRRARPSPWRLVAPLALVLLASGIALGAWMLREPAAVEPPVTRSDRAPREAPTADAGLAHAEPTPVRVEPLLDAGARAPALVETPPAPRGPRRVPRGPARPPSAEPPAPERTPVLGTNAAPIIED
jgi:serine/threonine-protein kinase